MIFSYSGANTFLHKTNPLLKLLLLFAFAFCPWYVSLPVMVVLTLAIKIPLIKNLGQTWFLLILAVLIWLSNGWASALSFVSVILSGLILTDTTDPEDLAQSLRPIIGESLSLGISVTLAMLPVVLETTKEARLARKARGERLIGKGYLTSVISNLLDKSNDYSLAYKSRLT